MVKGIVVILHNKMKKYSTSNVCTEAYVGIQFLERVFRLGCLFRYADYRLRRLIYIGIRKCA